MLIAINNLHFESKLYRSKKDIIENKELDDISNSLAKKIYDKHLNQFESKIAKNEEGVRYLKVEDIESILKEETYNLFGNNKEFSRDFYSGCNIFSYIQEFNTYYLDPQCGDTGAETAYYDIYKATKTNDYLYIYENVRLAILDEIEEMNCEENDYKCVLNNKEKNEQYKWTFNKDSNGDYHLLRVEKVK